MVKGGNFGSVSSAVALGRKRQMEAAVGSAAAAKSSSSSTATTVSLSPPTKKQRRRVSLKAPAVMRDVTAFQKKHQVGEGTYGYVSLCN